MSAFKLGEKKLFLILNDGSDLRTCERFISFFFLFLSFFAVMYCGVFMFEEYYVRVIIFFLKLIFIV